MKQKRTLALAASCLMLLTANAQQAFEMGNPNDEENYGYLREYSALKDYVDYTKYPNFKLGVGTTVNEYLRKGVFYDLINSNFTETVAGNAMKQSSCVRNDGSMDFSNVKRYVEEATGAGLSVYGHTLAWHSQQATGWLNSLIKDKPAPEIDGDILTYTEIASKDFCTQHNIGWHSSETDFGYSITFDATNGMCVHTTKLTPNFWDVQYVAMDNIPTEQGGNYLMTMTVRGSDNGNIHSKLGDWNGGPTATIPFTTEWQDVEIEYKNTINGSFLLLQHGDYVGDIFIKKITFAKPTRGTTITEDRRCIVVNATERVEAAWDNQFWIVTGDFPAGCSYEFHADVRADKPAYASTQIHNAPGSYVHWAAVGDVQFSTEWKTWSSSGHFDQAGSSIAFNLNEFEEDNNYYFDNVSLKINGEERVINGDLEGSDTSSFYVKVSRGGVSHATITEQISYIYVPSTIPLTMEEKHDTLVWAMDKWIHGMMDACDGRVKAWDVVNEAISGGNADAEGVYALQHDNGSDNFYWQDHMGDLEYVRQAIRLARLYGPQDIKLFINDYNLESDWDSNGKLKSLIKWIERWEADGVTYVDGIGTQMHISCYMNDRTQNSKKNGIEQMLKLMAATGKWVRISELDMGMVDANGKDVPTSQMTEDMHHRMADLYEWIVKKYLEIVPVEQQWGICQWCPTDSPANSGWRADAPVGLWTLEYYRKHAYAGVAEGLGGVVNSIGQVAVDHKAIAAPFYNLRGVLMDADDVEELPAGLYIANGKKFLKK